MAQGAVALVLCALVCWALPAASAEAAGLNCKPGVWVIGARGSGEKPDNDPGKVAGAFAKRLEAVAAAGAVGSEGLGYPAVAAIEWWSITLPTGVAKKVQYDRSVRSGIANLVGAVRHRADTCKQQKIVLAGYSQGAQVVRESLPQLTKLSNHIGAVVLFGDPGFDPDTWADKGGSYSHKRHGILGLPGHDFPREFDHIISYCRDGDLVCQGAPNTTEAHKHYAPDLTGGAVVRVADWLDLFRPPSCTPANSISAIVDDSGSMRSNDPAAIRRAALELLITKPSTQGKELGAVEFGSSAASLFAPALVGSARASMLAALGGLANDGAADGGGSTNYNAAFLASAGAQPQAGARIFLTDGGHNEGLYEDRHAGGPPTYVIGLNIGPAGAGNAEADLLARIAAETNGRYFPLVQAAGDDTATQLARLQPAINEIDALTGCQKIQIQQQQAFSSVGQRGAPVTSRFRHRKALEVVASWPAIGIDLDLAAAAARNRAGRIVADLQGRKRIAGSKRRRAKLAVNRVEGETFETVTVQRPPGADSLVVRFAAAALTAPVEASIQVRSVAPGAPAGTTTAGAPPPAGAPASTPGPSGGGSGGSTGGGGGSAPPRRVIVVDNRVTNGMGMREDSTPVRLTTQPWTFCSSRGCNINGTERSSGGSYDAAVCQTNGERTTNGNDGSAADDANPERFESTRYYGVGLAGGTFGYVSEVWIRAADRGGLGLPAC